MGFFSWFSSCGTADEDGGGPPSLLRTNYEDPDLEEIQRRAAEDVARVREDDKYFGGADSDEI